MTADIVAPTATYRLQLNREFTFADASALIPYLSELGISHLYLSPILKARPGSTHGYDTVDHHQINPELGTLENFRALVAAARGAKLGILLDFVPNHMGVGGADNALWLDVLQHGQASQYADWFDIDWAVPDARLTGKLLVPFLGLSYAEALHSGQIVLQAETDSIAIWAHGEHKMPLRPEDEQHLLEHYGSYAKAAAALNGIAGEPTSWLALDELIGRQHWRLAHYLNAADEVNYRRFFTNSDLAGIRIDRPEVFAHAHKLIFHLIAEGLVDGLRIDHVDGLLDPTGYLEHLVVHAPRPIYLLVEKILAPHEQLRADWPVHGTTGYEFGAQLTRLLTNATGEAALSKTYRAFSGNHVSPEDEAYRSKLHIMDGELSAELTALARRFAALARSVPETADLTENGLRKALRELIAGLAVYRTYSDGVHPDARDQREISYAAAKARQARPFDNPAVLDFLEHLLSGHLSHQYSPALLMAAIGKFQQLTGPVMAKGLEDTALYRFNRLVSLNEVGAHPERFSTDVDAFHAANQYRLTHHPAAILATTTHDTKRGEDTRTRIAAIADALERWNAVIHEWRDLLPANAIDANELYLFFQLLLGGWPLFGEADSAAIELLAERLTGAMTKSVREARINSDWNVPSAAYEEAVRQFVADAMRNRAFLASFAGFAAQLAPAAQRKSLVQLALKLTVPGVPDIYRGAEDWEQSFVDPDNRRPVDFSALAHRLAAASTNPADTKLRLTQLLLQLRRSNAALFAHGSYLPIAMPEGIIGFSRHCNGQDLVVIADLTPRRRPLPPEIDLPDYTKFSSVLAPLVADAFEQLGVEILLRT